MAARRRRTPVALWVLSAVALTLAATHVLWPDRVDILTVAILLVAGLPWMPRIFEHIELPGGWKLQFRQIQERLDRTESTAHAALSAVAEGAEAVTDPSAVPLGSVADLATEANRVRTEVEGRAQSDAFSQLIGKMMVRTVADATFDAVAALRLSDPGMRLAGYAYMYVRRDPAAFAELVDALVDRENTALGQYWALQAVRRTLGRVDPAALPADLAVRLAALRAELPEGSSRRAELEEILRRLPSAPPAVADGTPPDQTAAPAVADGTPPDQTATGVSLPPTPAPPPR